MTVLSEPGLWRPYADDPLFVPELLLGVHALEPTDADRLARYLAALVQRRGVVHTTVAFNAVYFGYDLDFGGYVGGPLDLDAFPVVAFGETTDALPVGAMVNVATGGDEPLYAEVVYKEGAHPALGDDGDVPAWLSGAPAGARGPGMSPQAGERPLLDERLVPDFDAFGSALAATPAKLDRLRRRGRWLDADGHLQLQARYQSAEDAEVSDVEFYARYLLSTGREQLLGGPLPLLLTVDAGEQQLAAALRAALAAVGDALAAVPALRMWQGYAFARSAFAARLSDVGPLGRSDLETLATAVGRAGQPAVRRRYGPSGPTVRYTAVGPLLRTVTDGQRRLQGLGYPAAVCHANAVIGDYARGDADETGALPGGAHLRLDDPWQGGGVWRASNPPGAHASVDPLVPYGLGWLESAPAVVADAEPDADYLKDVDEPADVLAVTDSHLSWTVTLRLAHTLAGVAAVPDRVVEELDAAGLVGAGLRLVLSHDGYDLDPTEMTQAVELTRDAGRIRLTGVTWPLEFFPGIVLTFTWQRGAVLLRARSTLLEAPVEIDRVVYEHRFDPAVLTRDTAPGCVRRGARAHGPLTLRERVLRAVRRTGRLQADGVAVLLRDLLADLVYGPQAGPAGAAALEPVVHALLADGKLTEYPAALVGGQLIWPVDDGSLTVLVWRPVLTAAAPQQRPAPDSEGPEPSGMPVPGSEPAWDLDRFVHQHTVAPFLRRLPAGARASAHQREEYRRLTARYGRPRDLPTGYTLVREHTRGG